MHLTSNLNMFKAGFKSTIMVVDSVIINPRVVTSFVSHVYVNNVFCNENNIVSRTSLFSYVLQYLNV